jgi:predicted XRE-type DNA-binding protein
VSCFAQGDSDGTWAEYMLASPEQLLPAHDQFTPEQAAVFFDETQPRISDLMNGDIERFSIDKLVMMIAKAGMDIRVEVNIKAA